MDNLSLPFLDLPNDFVQLLRVNMRHSGAWHSDLKKYIIENKSLNGIIQKIFSDVKQNDIGFYINTFGWGVLRNKITAYYIYFSKYKEYPEEIKIDILDDMIKMEEDLAFIEVSGFSRVLMFAFYLKLNCIEENIENIRDHPFYPNQKIIDFLKRSQQKIIRVDYIIILLHYYISFFNDLKVEEFLYGGDSYHLIYSKLTVEQREIFCSNFLNYTGAIGDNEILVSKRVQ